MFKKVKSLAVFAVLLLSIVLMGGCTPAQDGVIYFDAASAGWENAKEIRLFISDVSSGDLAPADSKDLAGTAGSSFVWTFDSVDSVLKYDHAYSIVFRRTDTSEETYPLLTDTSCCGDTAYADQRVLENPFDSEESLYEVRWKNSSLGPMLRITSLGNVVGEQAAVSTSAYRMLVNFLTSEDRESLNNALQHNSKDAQATIATIAGALRLTKQDVAHAIEEAKSIGNSVTGVKADWSQKWDIDKFRVPKSSDRSGD